MARRHVSLVLDDWDQQKKAALDPEVKASLAANRQEVLGLLGTAGLKFHAPSYLTLVTEATAEVREHLVSHSLGEAAEIERLWRASAGSAHGKMWPAIELRVSIEINGRPYTFPDATAMSAMLILAERVTSYGVARFIDRAEHESELGKRLKEAADALYRRIPKVPGAPEAMTHPEDTANATD